MLILAMAAISGMGTGTGAGTSATAVEPAAAQRMTRMVDLYREVCLRTFPDDAAMATAMRAKGAAELPPDEVKVTMRNDPARGWSLEDGKVTVWLEYPPFHACSVRWMTPTLGDLAEYHALAARYAREVGGFSPMQSFNADHGDIRIHAVGEQRTMPGGSTEALFVFVQQITDHARRAAGETGYSIRFVHQFAQPPPGT